MHLLYGLFVALTIVVANETASLEYCRSPQHPCRYRNFWDIKEIDLCMCRTGHCSTDSSDRRRVITFDRYRGPWDYIDTHQFLFCDDVIPQRRCEEGEEHISIQYQYHESYASAKLIKASCRCWESIPMQIKKTYDVEDELASYREILICSDMMPPCMPYQPSSTRHISRLDTQERNITESYCKCKLSGLPSLQWEDPDLTITVDLSTMWSILGDANGTLVNGSRGNTFRDVDNYDASEEWQPVSLRAKHALLKEIRFLKLRCRCPDGQPMMSRRAYMVEDSQYFYEHYVCRFDLPDLKTHQLCMTRKPNLDEMTVHGICPKYSYCKLAEEGSDLIHYGIEVSDGEQLGLCATAPGDELLISLLTKLQLWSIDTCMIIHKRICV